MDEEEKGIADGVGGSSARQRHKSATIMEKTSNWKRRESCFICLASFISQVHENGVPVTSKLLIKKSKVIGK